MINKEVLEQFLYKPAESTEKLFIEKHLEIYYSMYIEETGRVKAQILLTNY